MQLLIGSCTSLYFAMLKNDAQNMHFMVKKCFKKNGKMCIGENAYKNAYSDTYNNTYNFIVNFSCILKKPFTKWDRMDLCLSPSYHCHLQVWRRSWSRCSPSCYHYHPFTCRICVGLSYITGEREKAR